ncbi:MAG TPA: translocation/assembly module TamB domain-containing protein [Candidatus Aminicenantes bacterium]|nr:translocation/assembly module TamB domain-containing protein [Candidatus Aminicenantes bacterium]HRY65015.1 translocation/assembly module TamB domain-containing protein [Candidatus Aminicenantes bacterium]HRZ71928.1 translocation/assembly module TamB domain-containing protein [Candidatus Aminicenantes bacterium]
MRIQAILRLGERARTLARRIRRAAVFLLVLAVLATSVIVAKNALVREIGSQVHKKFAYDRLRVSYFPPALVIENFRSLGPAPLLRARRIRIEIPYLSLLRNRRILSVVIQSPEIRVRPSPAAAGTPRRKARPPLSLLELPFIVSRGVVEDGVFVYEGQGVTIEARGLRALVTQSGEAYAVRATAESSRYTKPQHGPIPLGALTVILNGRGEDATVSRLSFEGPGLSVTATGRVRTILDPAFEMDARFDVGADILDDLLRMPFGWGGRINGEARVERRDRRLAITTSVASDTLAVNEVPMGRIRGRFELAPETGGRLELGLSKPDRPAESLILTFAGGRVEGRAAPMIVDPVFRDISIPWPVRSAAWGTFTLAHKQLSVEAEFRDDALERRNGIYAFRGAVKVGVDFPGHIVTVETPGLESDFGRLEATARIDLKGDLDARIRGPIADVRETREFVQAMLDQTFGFGEVRGRGYADAHLTGRSASPALDLRATLAPGGFGLFDAASVEAGLTFAGNVFEGRFDIDDPELMGQVEVRAAAGDLAVDVGKSEGELARILPALEIPVSLSGRVAGDFRMTWKNGGDQEFEGTFTSPEVKFFGQTGSNVSGRLAWKAGRLSFPELAMDFDGGRLEGRFLIAPSAGDFDFDLRGEELDFSRIVPSASGQLSLSLAGRGVFGRDRLSGLFDVKDMLLAPIDRTEARGELAVGVAGGRISLGLKGGLVPGDNPFDGVFEFPVSGEPWSGTVTGRVTDLDLVVPWDGAQGRIDYAARIVSTPAGAGLAVSLDVDAPVMPLPGFPYAVTSFVSPMAYADGVLTIKSFAGRLGGGTLTGSGTVGLGQEGIAAMDLRLEGKDMVLSPMERMRAQVDGSLRLLKGPRRFVTEGELLFNRLTWRREIYEGFSFSSQTPAETPGPSFFDGMTLNIRLRGDENAAIENSLGRFGARFNLTVVGDFDEPALLGDIDLLNGDFYFQDRSFRVIHGRLGFADPVNAEPFLDFRGETYVKDYRVTLNMSGPVSRLKPEFSSSPPLPPEEILSLLALGDSFRRMYYSYSGDRSTALNTASLLTYQIADLAKRRTGGLFSLDRFRIDPYVPESGPGGIGARITVGKKISNNLLVLYSTILANSSVRSMIDESPIFRMEWDISRRFSLVGGRDDRGRLGFDVKFRRRF